MVDPTYDLIVAEFHIYIEHGIKEVKTTKSLFTNMVIAAIEE